MKNSQKVSEGYALELKRRADALRNQAASIEPTVALVKLTAAETLEGLVNEYLDETDQELQVNYVFSTKKPAPGSPGVSSIGTPGTDT